MDVTETLRRAQALADAGQRDAELVGLCTALIASETIPAAAHGRVLVWLAEAQLATGDLAGVARTVALGARAELPTAQRRSLERALTTARNREAGRIPVPKPLLTPPPRPAASAAKPRARAASTATKRAPARKATATRAPAAPATPPAVSRLLAASTPDSALIDAAAHEVDATSLARAAAELRRRGQAEAAAELGRRALDEHPELRTVPIAVVAVANALEDCSRKGDAAQLLEPLLRTGPDGLTTDRFLLTAGLRVVGDDALAAEIRARLEAG